MNCLIWAAVSSRPQAEKDSLPQQIAAAREAIAQREGWHEVADPLVIPGHSRSYLFLADAAHDMPQYAALMDLARSGSIDLLICRSYDRLGRTDALVAQVLGYLKSYNVQTLSLDMPAQVIDPEHYRGDLDQSSIWTSAIGGARAQSEVVELRRRHRYGMRARIRKGKHPGKAPYGYRKADSGLVVVEEEAQVVRQVYAWFMAGMAPVRIAERLAAQGEAVRNEQRVRYLLRNPTYCGTVAYHRTDGHSRIRPRSDWLLAEGQHEPIISREEWEAAQAEYGRRGGRAPYTNYPLSGLVICGYCGRRMTAHRTTHRAKPYAYYICAKPDCQRNSIHAEELEDTVAGWVWASCQGDTLDAVIAELSKDANDHGDELDRLRRAEARTSAAIDRYQRDYEYGLLESADYYGNRARLADDLAGIRDDIAALEVDQVDPGRIAEAMGSLLALTDSEHADRWRENPAAVKAALRQAGVRVTVASGAVTISLA